MRRCGKMIQRRAVCHRVRHASTISFQYSSFRNPDSLLAFTSTCTFFA
jgi:hypothetical protein